jgi:uncharacterized damage-inducible protein DinB
MASIAELLQELEQEAGTTRKVLERVPDGQFDWQPHEKSMTLGQLAMHIAQLPGGIAEISTWPSFDVAIQQPRTSATNTAELLDALDESVARAQAVLSEMGDSALTTSWRLVNGEHEIMAIPRAALLRTIMLNHWYHHRGQLTVYLRQLGVPLPPIYGPSADEQPFGP